MRLIHTVIVPVVALALAACSGGGAKVSREPIRLDLAMVASAGVNPDDQKRAAPIVVRVYELKTDAAFSSADYFSLQDKDKTVLTDDLVARDQFQLRPGERASIRRMIDPATTTLGILAAYRDLPNSVWRVAYRLPVAPEAAWYWRTPKLKLTVYLDANAIRVTESK
ncbi:type VI secretion system lipoprotein TssJ [Paraburkholderia fungorum]|uniref:type VI secretion system lipoprotein TssJ n=1 Tax=Paraburkholderia fungorum TaxID=134537 RepID=UPI0038B7722D